MSGTLIIKPLNAKLTRDTETWGKMDPFCVVKVGGQQQRTRTHNDAGKYPQWNDTLSFKRTSEMIAEIEIWDKDEVSKNDLIAQGSLAITSYLNKPTGTEWVNLTYKVMDATILGKISWIIIS